MDRALIGADGAARARVVVELVPVADPNLDHRVLRARPKAPVAFETVAAGQAAPRFEARLGVGQAADDLGEAIDPRPWLQFGLAATGGITEEPRVQQVEGGLGVLGNPSGGLVA